MNIDQVKQKKCFYCEKLRAHISAVACVDNQRNADDSHNKCCLNCEKGKQMKEMVEKVKSWNWNPHTRIGYCSGCGEFKIIKDIKNWLCSKCEYRAKNNKEINKMENKEKQSKEIYEMDNNKRTITLDFTEHKELYEKIIKEAKEQFRPVELQVLFMINLFFQIIDKNREKESKEATHSISTFGKILKN